MKKTIVFLLINGCLWLSTSFTFSKKKVIYGFDKIEKNWGKVKDRLFANKFEVTNLEYQIFLQSISKNEKRSTKKEIFKIYNGNWDKLSLIHI